MEILKIPGTKYTLEINFDPDTGHLEMAGSSYPENAVEFFQPIFEWLENYVSKVKNSILLSLNFDYLNSISTRCIINILEILEMYYNGGGKVEVNWYCAKDNEDMLQMAQEIAEDVKLPINVISFSREVRD